MYFAASFSEVPANFQFCRALQVKLNWKYQLKQFHCTSKIYLDVKASGFVPMTKGSAVWIPAVAELSFGVKLNFWLFGTQ